MDVFSVSQMLPGNHVAGRGFSLIYYFDQIIVVALKARLGDMLEKQVLIAAVSAGIMWLCLNRGM